MIKRTLAPATSTGRRLILPSRRNSRGDSILWCLLAAETLYNLHPIDANARLTRPNVEPVNADQIYWVCRLFAQQCRVDCSQSVYFPHPSLTTKLLFPPLFSLSLSPLLLYSTTHPLGSILRLPFTSMPPPDRDVSGTAQNQKRGGE